MNATPTLNGRDFETLCHLVHRAYGIDLAVMGPCLVERRIQQFCAQHGLDSLAACVRFLEEAPAHVEALADVTYSQRTRFNRDPEHFAVLVDMVRAAGPRAFRTPGGWRIACFACSTGQEAYSLAIHLLEHAFPDTIAQPAAGAGDTSADGPFHIDASDCSVAAVEQARLGRYRRADVQKLHPMPWSRYVVDTGDEEWVTIAPSVARFVSFRPFNLVTSPYPEAGSLDAVFLRNALDFHTAASRAAVLDHVHGSLAEGGLLVLGDLTIAAARPMPSSMAPLRVEDHGFEAIASGCYRARKEGSC
jgi:chemotaxis methyl-accepting protein methylase